MRYKYNTAVENFPFLLLKQDNLFFRLKHVLTNIKDVEEKQETIERKTAQKEVVVMKKMREP